MNTHWKRLGIDNESGFEVCHAPAKDLGAIEELAVQVVQETMDESPDDDNSDGIINYSHLYSEEQLDALRLANSHIEKWITQRTIVSRVKASHSVPMYSLLTIEELKFFETAAQFEEWLKS